MSTFNISTFHLYSKITNFHLYILKLFTQGIEGGYPSSRPSLPFGSYNATSHK